LEKSYRFAASAGGRCERSLLNVIVITWLSGTSRNCNAVHLREWVHATANHFVWPSICASLAILTQIRSPVRPYPVKLSTVNARRPAGPKFAFKTIAAGGKMKQTASRAVWRAQTRQAKKESRGSAETWKKERKNRSYAVDASAG